MERILVDEKTGEKFLLKSLSEVKSQEKKLKVAFIPGHHEGSMGDYSHHFEKYEWEFWGDWIDRYADIIERETGVEIEVFYHEATINSYTKRQEEMGKLVEDTGCGLALEFHWNSFDPDKDGKDNASGCEALICRDYDGPIAEAASSWSHYLNVKLGYKNRGLKLVGPEENGYGFLSKMPCSAILLEWFFADSDDAPKFTDNAGIKALVELINEYKSFER